jgi:tetratricopeptide (TPR) repeat protein
MKAMTKTFCAMLLILVATTTFAQRKITGTVYNNGQPAAGILVEANKTNATFYTSFDGVYELTISPKTTTLKFTFLDQSKKLDITGNTSDVINFSFDGKEIPQDAGEPGVILLSSEELQKNRDMDFLNNYSLYREFFKQNDYKSAMPHWRIVYKTYPKSSSSIYVDGLKMYETLLSQEKDTRVKKMYLDTMMQVYDKRMKYFDNIGELMGRKAAKYLETILTFDLSEKELIEGIKKGNEFAETSINESKENTEAAVLVFFMQSTKRLYAYNAITKAKVVENYERVTGILDAQSKVDAQKENAAQAMPLIDKIIEDSGALDCAGLVELYTEKYNQNPDNVDLIKKMLRIFRKENCDNELMLKASEKLYQLEPSAEAAFGMARMFLKKEETAKALEYYEKAYTLETNADTKATYYFEAAMLSLQKGSLRSARDLAKQAISNKADYCDAYMLLGEIYGQASKEYSTDDFERSTVFWVAVDYFRKAASIEKCKADAQAKVSFYQNYFPGKEEAFFRGLSVGQSYSVGGWINETTRVSVK